MKFAKYTFLIAGIYGLLVLLPNYFLEKQVGIDHPPAVTHPEYFYGFIGTAVAFQFVFLIISRDPIKYRMMIIPSVIEKFTFGIAALLLLAANNIPMPVFAFAMIDVTLGLLFIISYFRLRKAGDGRS